MIAAAGMSCDALDGGGQIAIAARDHGGQPVDLVRRFRRRLDFNPAADALEDDCGIEGIGGGEHGVTFKTRVVIPGCASWRRPGIHTHDRGHGFRVRSFHSRPGMTPYFQRLSGASRAAIFSTNSTMLRRSLGSGLRVKGGGGAKPSDVARKSET